MAAGAGKPLALVQTGEEIEVVVCKRQIDLVVSKEELARG